MSFKPKAARILGYLLAVGLIGECLAGDSPPGDRSVYRLRASVVGAAGSPCASPTARACGTVAQPMPAGVSSAGSKVLYAGFWKGSTLITSDVGPDPAGQIRNELFGNSPNPFDGSTWIAFSVAGRASVSLKVYDASGRCLRTLVDGEVGPGVHRAFWDGHDDSGALLASGLYFYRVTIGTYVSSRKMMLVR